MGQAVGRNKCILFARCDSGTPIKESLEKQIAMLDRYATEHGLTKVGEVRLSGGCSRQLVSEMNSLIHRKKTQDDFDTLLVVDHSRLVRNFRLGMLKIFDELPKAGIQVTSIHEPDLGHIKCSLMAFVQEKWRSVLAGETPPEASKLERLGLRVVSVTRTIWPEPAHVDTQMQFLSRCAVANGFVVVDTLTLDGVSDWEMGQRMRRLIGRKKRRDDFDVVLVMDRHCLSGREGSLRILEGLKRAGVEVVTLLDDTSGWGPLIRNVTTSHAHGSKGVSRD